MQRGILAAVWVGFVVYAFGFAPPNQPSTFELIRQLSTAQVEGINPWIVALFNLMGIWPLIYFTLLVVDGQGQRLRAWPFAVGAFALGAFALLPYLIGRSPLKLRAPVSFASPSRLIQLVESKRWAALLGAGMMGLLIYGLTQGLPGGNWASFIGQWQGDRFVHVMSLDFCLLSVLFPILAREDLARRDGILAPWVRWLMWVPVVGSVGYLLLRPPLAAPSPTASGAESVQVEAS
jgi:hypothetical protein